MIRKYFPYALSAVLVIGLLTAIFAGPPVYRWLRTRSLRFARLGEWFQHAADHPDWAIAAGQSCGSAPFVMPTSGYIGFLWDDSFRLGNHHQGLDIFGGGEGGVTRVVAAFPGYLTRQLDWKSTVILRVPDDPLQPGRQIWLYYTHMAAPDGASFISQAFPPGSSEVFVEAGTVLGFQGNYSGSPNNPTGVHLHFSIVLDDGNGKYRNELDFANTLDPSPYLGFEVNGSEVGNALPRCGK